MQLLVSVRYYNARLQPISNRSITNAIQGLQTATMERAISWGGGEG